MYEGKNEAAKMVDVANENEQINMNGCVTE